METLINNGNNGKIEEKDIPFDYEKVKEHRKKDDRLDFIYGDLTNHKELPIDEERKIRKLIENVLDSDFDYFCSDFSKKKK